MNFLILLLLLVFLALVLKSRFLSFRAQSPADYAGTGPAFHIKTHLAGPIKSEGVIFGPTGKVSASFVADMMGEWDGDTGTLSERFTYSSGRTQQRKWHLKLQSGNRFVATADDIEGTGIGVVSGSSVKLTYRIVLPEEAGGHKLNVTDWMYLTESGVIMNKSEMRMFGVKVAELVANMRP